MPVVAIANQKGGVQKTTTAVSLAVLSARQYGIKTHLIDMDPQANAGHSFGIEEGEGALFHALYNRSNLSIVPINDLLSITPASIDLASAETKFAEKISREFLLKNCIDQTPELTNDTLIIIDCPPSLGVLSVNSLSAADGVLVPVQPGGFEIRGLGYLMQVVSELKEFANPTLEILGAILTNCNLRRAINATIRKEIEAHFEVLGMVKIDASLAYALSAGNIYTHTGSAFSDYEHITSSLLTILHIQHTKPMEAVANG